MTKNQEQATEGKGGLLQDGVRIELEAKIVQLLRISSDRELDLIYRFAKTMKGLG